jgi:hypothetical protein
MIGLSLASASEIRCSTPNAEMHGIFFLQEINFCSSSSKKKKKSTVEKPFSANASVGQIPTHPPHSTHKEGVKVGILSAISIVSAGHTSTHCVHWENLLTLLTQEARSN